jgi:hydrogenase maturation protease
MSIEAMNLATVDKIAKAVLYEGYMLYPYRPSSVKNRRRWNFGVLCPLSYSEAQKGTEAWTMQTECLVEGSSLTGIEVRVRFLQLVTRSVGQLTTPANELLPGEIPEFRLVERLTVDGHVYQPWQEAVEREIVAPVCNVAALAHSAITQTFAFPAEKQLEPLRESDGRIVGILVRERYDLLGEVEISGVPEDGGISKVSVRIRNTTPFEVEDGTSREGALLSALVSAHTVLGVQDGRFISLLSPPEAISAVAANCKNVGTWPVLVGEEGQCDTVLSSPIILYDYPQIAPESAGDLFDGTEIDEILSLRIMTLTDEEKREMSQSDERARAMLERTETMPVEQFMKLHGVLRGLHPLKEEAQ